jgi:DNA-binding response OmpR family regulator
MPTVGGIELCRMLRANAKTKQIPIIMLTVEATETDKVIGLGIGADDYIVKPFSPKELVARIKSLLRRSQSAGGNSDNGSTISTPGLEINVDSQTVKCAGKQIELRPKEFDLLVLFIKKPNVVLDRTFILENVFGYKIPISTRTIDTHIKNLRRALGPFGKKIKTVFGRGFKFVP